MRLQGVLDSSTAVVSTRAAADGDNSTWTSVGGDVPVPLGNGGGTRRHRTALNGARSERGAASKAPSRSWRRRSSRFSFPSGLNEADG